MSMAGYTKLFNSILASTIWRAPNTTRIVWITMLAMADKDGVVEGSVPGLADFARVSVDEARKALDELASPDSDSRTPDNDGRRIEVMEGTGWRLLNHGKYRAKMSEDERREYNRQKQKEWRERKKPSNSVNDSQSQSAMSAQAEADSKAGTAKHTQARGLPVSIEQAKAMAGTVGVPPEYAETIFLEHDGASWEDGQGRPINNFSSYIKSRFNNRTEKHAREEKRYAARGGTNGGTFKRPETVHALQARVDAARDRIAKLNSGRYSTEEDAAAARAEVETLQANVTTWKKEIIAA